MEIPMSWEKNPISACPHREHGVQHLEGEIPSVMGQKPDLSAPHREEVTVVGEAPPPEFQDHAEETTVTAEAPPPLRF